jgi:8-oxo-dGTP diphosphatase
MSQAEQAVFTNMCMIYDNNGNVLVQDRIDPGWSGITFPGGHVKPGESFVESVIREVKEETGLTIKNPRLCGLKQFRDRNGARYVVILFKTNTFYGQLQSSDEGQVFWIKRSDLNNFKQVDDFDKMLEVFENEDLSECYYQNTDEEWKIELL